MWSRGWTWVQPLFLFAIIEPMSRPHIVILGAGFGGVYVAKKLVKEVKAGNIDVTIVNRTNSFLFTPLLHEVATGSLPARNVAESLREIFVRTPVKIIQGNVLSINSAHQNVLIRGYGDTEISLHYDYLLIATGAETNYYGIPGAEEFTMPLKTLTNAMDIRTKIIDMFEQAVITPDPEARRALLSFVVVGGGATGVEVAAELADFVEGMVKRYYGKVHCRDEDLRRCELEEASITLIHAGKELLEMFSPNLRRAALERLTRSGVKVMVQTSVTNVTAHELTTVPQGSAPGTKGTDMHASVIIWSAGVKASVPKFTDTAPTLSGGRLAVDNFFRLLGSDKVFAMGDVAAYVDSHSNGKPVPQLAQVAEAESETIAKNILASLHKEPLTEFHFHSEGSMVSVGQWFAIGEIWSMKIAGRFTWWLWRTVYLFKFASNKKRVRIAFEWALQLLFPRDITKLS